MAVLLDFNSIKETPFISSSFTPPRHKHSHSFFELSFCVSGKSVNTINGTSFPFQNGTCVILRPGDEHSLSEYDPRVYEHIDLYATADFFKTLCNAFHEELYDEIMSLDTPICFSLPNEIFSYLFNQSLVLKEMIANKNKFFKTLYSSMISVILSEWVKTRDYSKKYMPTWLSDLLPKFNNVNFVQKKHNANCWRMRFFATLFFNSI